MLRTFGELTLDGQAAPRKPALALCYLAIEGSQPRRRIAELLWPATTRPLSNLSVALSALRRLAPDAVQSDDARVAARIRSDAAELLAALERRDVGSALELYRGPFLHGVDTRSCSTELDEWIASTRELLAGRLRSALLGRAAASSDGGRHDRAARLADRAHRLAGAAPPGPGELATMHHVFLVAGHPAAQEVAREAGELGLELGRPRAATAPAAPRAAPDLPPLPRPRAPLVGRDVPLAELAALAADPAIRLLALSGPGGIGKSRLALQLAHEQLLEDRFEGGVGFVELEALPDGADLGAAVGRALGLGADADDAGPRLRTRLASRGTLLVLDGAEHLADVGRWTSELIEACPRLSVMVTSRQRILSPHAWHYRLDGLPLPEPGTPAELAARSDPVRLFVQCARRADARFRLEPEDVPHVLSLCSAVGGSPLGIELAAAWVRAVPLRELAEEARRDLASVVGAGDRGATDRPGARASFERSWRRLDEAQRDALARLSVFTGGFGLQRARQVAGASLSTLAALADASLLRVGDDGRYDRHPLVHRFARERLAERPEEERRIAIRHAEAFLGDLVDADPDARQAPTAPLLELETDFENLRAAWRTAVEHGRMELVAAAALPLARLCDARARFRDGARLFAAVDDAAPRPNGDEATLRTARARARLARAWMLLRTGLYREGRAQAEAGLALLDDEADHRETRAWALHTLATAAYKAGRYAEAEELFGKLHRAALDGDDPALRGEAVGRLALVAQAVGRDDLARRRYLEALDLSRADGDTASTVTQLLNLGALELNTGRHDSARRRFEEGRRIATAIGYQQVLPILLHNLANVTCKVGAYDEAIALAREARDRVTASGERGLESGMLATLGWIELEAGDRVAAHRDVREALRVARAIDDEPAVLTALVRLAQVWLADGRFATARRVLDVAIGHPATLTWARRLAERLRDEAADDRRAVGVDAGGAASDRPSLSALVDGILAAG
jgi:predicted ATPase